MSIATRWPVLITVDLTASEIDSDGHASDAAIERVFGEARQVYLRECESLREQTLEVLRTDIRRGDSRVTPRGVTVATGVVEIFPEAFVMNARIRGRDDGELVADATCTLTTGGELPVACRDEFIARAHNARHSH
jgi:acyl-CoA thioesterase FadM